MEKFVTVGMCVFNGEQFVEESLNSIFNQTYKNIEIIVFNDNSTDNTISILEKYKNKITIINSTKNYGVGVGRQVIKTIARGDYLIFIDADDIFFKDRIEFLVNLALENNSDIVIDSYEEITLEGQPTGRVLRVPDYVASDEFFTRLFERNRMLPHPLISKKCYKKIDFDTNLRYSEDYDYWIKCSINGCRFCRSPEIKMKYRRVPNSLSSNLEKSLKASRYILKKYDLKEMIKLYRKRGFEESIINYMACIYSIFVGDYGNALKYAEKGWKNEEVDDDINFYLGTLYFKLGNYTKAKAKMEEHLKKFPNSPAGWNNYALLHKNKDRNKFLNKALSILPSYIDAKWNLLNEKEEKITFTQIRV